MTEAYLIEDGRITEPLREGNLIGNGPAVLAAIDAVGDDFAMGAGDVRQGRPGVLRRRRGPHAAGPRADDRRNRRLTRAIGRHPCRCCSQRSLGWVAGLRQVRRRRALL